MKAVHLFLDNIYYLMYEHLFLHICKLVFIWLAYAWPGQCGNGNNQIACELKYPFYLCDIDNAFQPYDL